MDPLFFLGKVALACILPFHLALILLLLAALYRGRYAKTVSRSITAISCFLLFVPGLPVVADSWLIVLENQLPDRNLTEYPQAEAVIVLGGTVTRPFAPGFLPEEPAGARVQRAAIFWHARKAPVVVVTGGLPYVDAAGTTRTEAKDMAELLAALGVSKEAIIAEDQSRNTRENARFTGKVLNQRGIRKVLLVSSAFHLARAIPLFEAEGLTVIPVPTARTVANQQGWERWLPSPSGHQRFNTAFKETLGRSVDNARRYLGF